MLKKFIYMLQPMYLTKKEIKNLFSCCISEKNKSNQMTRKAVLKTTFTATTLHVPQPKQVSLT